MFLFFLIRYFSLIFLYRVSDQHTIQTCVEALVAMGYNRQEIEDSLSQVRYDDVFATYLLLGRKSTDVSYYLLRVVVQHYKYIA